MATPTLGTYLRRLKQAMATGQWPRTRIVNWSNGSAQSTMTLLFGPSSIATADGLASLPSVSPSADVEDAFQATFLVLVRRGHTIRGQASLGSWLHGVARRTALKLRTQSDRRRRREEKVARPDQAGISDDTTWGELRGILDEELERLPETCRAPLVLCFLEGRTQDEAASQLHVSKSTLRRHLERGRELLGRRLARRGATLGVALTAGLLSDCAQSATIPRIARADSRPPVTPPRTSRHRQVCCPPVSPRY